MADLTSPSTHLENIFPANTFAHDFWTGFGLTPTGNGTHLLPAGVIALQASQQEAHGPLIDMLKTMGVVAAVANWSGDRRQALYRLADDALLPMLRRHVPTGTELIVEGEPIALPTDWKVEDGRARSFHDLTTITANDIRHMDLKHADPLVTSNPLLVFSLRGQSEKFQQMAVEARPLLGEVCLRGQVTFWYAAPGTGKTLITLSLLTDAVRQGRIVPDNIFYINADDNGAGFATKLQLLDDLGAHTIVPGIRNFQSGELIALLHKMADKDEAKGALIIIDTVKKFTQIMDKKESSVFAQACRQVAMRGGTVLGLAHTTKSSNADGTPRYAGTTDLVDDADAAYTIRSLDKQASEKIVEFRCFKSRGDSAESAAYAYTAEKGLAYEELLSSVRPVDPEQLEDFRRVEVQRTDAELIDAVAACIAEGINTKMLLAKEVASRTGISARSAGRLLERYSGNDPIHHRWRFERGERGAQTFEMLTMPSGGVA